MKMHNKAFNDDYRNQDVRWVRGTRRLKEGIKRKARKFRRSINKNLCREELFSDDKR